LLAMILYAGAILTVMLLGDEAKHNAEIDEYFGNIGSAMFWHFCIVTLDGWPDLAWLAMDVHPVWSLYFVFMVVITNFAILNLMIGVICEKILSAEPDDSLAAFSEETAQFRETLQTLFNASDVDASGDVTRAELRDMLAKDRTRQILSAFGVNLNIPPHMLHKVMNLEGEGEATFEEFFDACLRLCGSRQNIHSLFVQHDIVHSNCAIGKGLESLEQQLLTVIRDLNSEEAALSKAEVEPQHVVESRRKWKAIEGRVDELGSRMDRFEQVHARILMSLKLAE